MSDEKVEKKIERQCTSQEKINIDKKRIVNKLFLCILIIIN